MCGGITQAVMRATPTGRAGRLRRSCRRPCLRAAMRHLSKVSGIYNRRMLFCSCECFVILLCLVRILYSP